MTEQSPITPPPELIREWAKFQGDTDPEALWFRIATRAAQYGADAELGACCEWLESEGWSGESRQLRAARRPKLASLKQQALEELEQLKLDAASMGLGFDAYAIRRALEQLDD